MEQVLFAAWCFAVALAGGLVGLVLGNIRLPATLLVASSAAAGTGANLVISAAAAAIATIAHLRARRISWRLFAWMTPPSVAGAVLGAYLSGVLPRTALLLVISAVLLSSAADLLRWTPPRRRSDDDATRVPGALLGARFTGRLSEPQLVRAIAIVLLVAAVGTAVEAVA